MKRKEKKLLREQVLQEELAAYRRILQRIGTGEWVSNTELEILPNAIKDLRKLLR